MKYLAVMLIVGILSGCVSTESGFVYEPETEHKSLVPYSIYTRSDSEKIYTGAYIYDNRLDLQNIADYEEFTEVRNDVYIISLDDENYSDKILECVGNNKIPMLILSADYNLGDLFFDAQKCGEYNLPMFLAVTCYDEDDVIFYKNAVDIFRYAAPSVKSVWCISADNLNWLALYPGSDYADIVGLNFVEKADEKGIVLNHTNLEFLLRNIDVPVMINAAVSHYCSENNRYYTYDTVKELGYIFGLAEDFDNICCINYINYPQADKYNKGDNFNVVPDMKLTQAYKNAQKSVADDRFKRHNCVAYKYNEKLFACKDSVDELKLTFNSIDTIIVEGKLYYDVDVHGFDFDDDNKKIFEIE